MSASMGAQSGAASDQTIFSRWKRDYRLSLALLVAGIVMVVAYFALGGWANSIGNSPRHSGPVLRSTSSEPPEVC